MRTWRARVAILALLAVGAGVVAAPTAPRLVVAGDSTASAYAPARRPRTGWGETLPQFLDLAVLNRAISGRSTRSYIAQGHLDTLARELRRGDVLLIQFGSAVLTRTGSTHSLRQTGADDLLIVIAYATR